MDDFADLFEDINFPLKVAYFADILLCWMTWTFHKKTIVEAHKKLSAFLKKLPNCIRRVESGLLVNFPTLEELVVAIQSELLYATQGDIEAHLNIIQESFDKYFSALDHLKKVDSSFFCFWCRLIAGRRYKQRTLIELKASEVKKTRFNTTSLENSGHS